MAREDPQTGLTHCNSQFDGDFGQAPLVGACSEIPSRPKMHFVLSLTVKLCGKRLLFPHHIRIHILYTHCHVIFWAVEWHFKTCARVRHIPHICSMGHENALGWRGTLWINFVIQQGARQKLASVYRADWHDRPLHLKRSLCLLYWACCTAVIFVWSKAHHMTVCFTLHGLFRCALSSTLISLCTLLLHFRFAFVMKGKGCLLY